MSTLIWPPIPPEELQREQDACVRRELEWLLTALQDTLESLKAGLEECSNLLTPKDIGSTLVLSSQRSESLKGFVTLVGTRIVKGDIQLRLPSLPPPRGQNSYRLAISSAPTAPTFVIEQLSTVRTLINSCLDVVDATRWTGDAQNADYISSQLRLLQENVQEAKQTLHGGQESQKAWYDDPIEEKVFDPPLPHNLSLHMSIADAALVLHVRTLEALPPGSSNGTSTPNSFTQQSYSGFSIRDRLAQALGGTRPPTHDEAEEIFNYRGQNVRVRDKLRVESQDPSLMAAMAKLSALEHTVALSRRALDVVLDKEEEA
ncbi:hypothetical protein MBLNU457_g2409t1 [Dothideomycetes sp. NU457]